MKQPMLLMILDGFGYREDDEGNAIKKAKIPFIKDLFTNNPHTLIHTSGSSVGLPDGQMGNSEVGHTNIGAGRIVYQDLVKINKDIETGKFYQNEEFKKAIFYCQLYDTNLHLFGLLSDGGVHSEIDHLFALLELCQKQDFKNVYIHCFLDGRDTPTTSGKKYIQMLEDKIKECKVGCIASVMGRYYAMDRDKRWNRIEKAYQAIVNHKAKVYSNAIDGIEDSYKSGVTDEFVRPFVLENGVGINKRDAVIFYNFRQDRARELTRSIVDLDFNEFLTKELSTYFVCMTEYDKDMPNVHIAYPPEHLDNTLGEYLSKQGKKQLRIAETEKYAHVTFFFNGGREEPYELEDRILVPSPKVSTYDLKPQMSAIEVTDHVVDAILYKDYDCIILNFANPDMLGHTGNLEATIQALETLDVCISKITKAIIGKGGAMLVTADHGNCEEMLTKDGNIMTSHTTNPVPCTLVGIDNITLHEGKLCDLAPTILDIMGLDKPKEMTGVSIIEKK